MQSTETTFAGLYRCKDLATQPPCKHLPWCVILLGVNKPRPWKLPWTSSKKRKKRTKNENTAMNEKAKAGELRLWDQAYKRSIESGVEKGAVMIVHVLSNSG